MEQWGCSCSFSCLSCLKDLQEIPTDPHYRDVKEEKGEMAKTFPRHGPLETSEGSRVPLACEVCQGGIPDMPVSSQSLVWIF